MIPNQNLKVPDPSGWIGGFAESNPRFAYPNRDLNSLPMLDNMANIPRIKRQQYIYWPEFSWQTKLGDEKSRCFQMFAHNISSIGYDDAGRIWSIICPQQGFCIPSIGCLNVEVTVTGQRGWVSETINEDWIAADMTVEGKIWFSPSSHQNWLVKRVWGLFKEKSLPFPSDKANAIQISTHMVDELFEPIFPIRAGESSRFTAPAKFRHQESARSVANIEVQIGPIIKKNIDVVDQFNEKILDLFNIFSGNMLLEQNVLTWNLWFREVKLVNTEEWRTRAEKWRQSIDEEHGLRLPDPQYADLRFLEPDESVSTNWKKFDDIIQIVESLI